MADVSVKREPEEEAPAEETADTMTAADLQTTPAQAAGRRTRKPVQPLGGVVTRRTSARQVASSASRGSAATESSNSSSRQSARATRQAGPRTRATPAAAAEGDAPAGTTPQRTSGRGTWKRKKSDAEELSTSEPEMEHDDSDSDPVWVPDATAGSKGAAGADADSSAVANDSVEPVAKVARRGKPAKATKAKAGARKSAATAGKKPNGASKSEAGGGGGAAKGGRRGGTRKAEPASSIDLGSGVAAPDSLQLKVEMPGESEEGGVGGGVKRDYTRRPATNTSSWRTPVPVVVTEPGAANTSGELQPGDYIIAVADVHRSRPPIWRIEGRSLLQRFEALETGEDTLLYRNSSSFSAWNPLEQSKYANISVRVHSNSRSATVVEVLEIHASPNSSLAKNGGTEARPAACGDQQPNLEEKFEVYLQTLLSHVLDPNFLAEVHRENDEYFLANLQTVDGENERRGAQIRQALWGPDLWTAITTLPDVRVSDLQPSQSTVVIKSESETENSAGNDVEVKKEVVDNAEVVEKVQCQGCGKETASRLAEFSGERYDSLDLSVAPHCGDKTETCNFRLCTSCAGPLPTFSQLYHYKYHAFHRCREKIERLKEEQKVTESHIILERCLQDDAWVNQMYADLQKLWRTCTLGSS